MLVNVSSTFHGDAPPPFLLSLGIPLGVSLFYLFILFYFVSFVCFRLRPLQVLLGVAVSYPPQRIVGSPSEQEAMLVQAARSSSS